MENHIIAIHLKDYFRIPGDTTENIESVKLENGLIESVNSVAVNIMRNRQTYYYTTSGSSFDDSSKTEVEALWSPRHNLYIRTKANWTTHDNLLSLPHF